MKELEKKNSEVEERLSTLQNENQMLRHVYIYILFHLPLPLPWFDSIFNWYDADLEEHNGWYARKEIEVDLRS